MIQIQNNFNLKACNTFGIDMKASEYIACFNEVSITQALKYINLHQKPFLILGGGSNILFTKNFEGVVIHPKQSNIKLTKETTEHVWLEVDAGVEWDNLVNHCVSNNWYGLENLSYIPGNVGASPVQNIGAYGVEAKDCIERVKGFYINNGHPFELNKNECQFGYRQSIFKSELKNKTVICSVIFKLNKQKSYTLDYGHVKEEVEKRGQLNLINVRQTIIEIRKSKLPEPQELGNAGSFFKNPIINIEHFNHLQNKFKSIPNYPIDKEQIKVPAGWLIEQSGWKGKAIGHAAVHNKQALVLVNKGKASGKDILDLANKIILDVNEKFGISIAPEVNII